MAIGNNIKKIFTNKVAILSLLGLVAFTGCGGQKTEEKAVKAVEAETPKVIKLGISGDENPIWESVRDRLAKENIQLKFVSFADYIRPNLALSEKEIDANAFQTVIYFEKFKEDHKLDTLVNLGYTLLAPMGVYSKKIKDISEVGEGAKIAIPNDVSNGGRALLLLQDAGLITLKEGVGALPTLKDIDKNPKNLQIIELVATQIPRSIDDVDAAAINNGVAVQAGYSPLKDSIFIENPKEERMKQYFNIIAAREDNKDAPEIKRLVEIYQTEETKKIVEDFYKGSSIPAF